MSSSDGTTGTDLLIIGCGYLGLRVAAAVRNERRVTALTRSDSRAELLRADKINAVVGDLTSPDRLPKLPAADVLLWSVGFDRSGTDRRSVWLRGAENVLACLPAPPRRFLYVSSTGVYGQDDGSVVDELSPAEPVSEGGRVCRETELMLSDRLAERLTILRLAGIYGPDRLLRRINEVRSGAVISGHPDAALNLIHVDDAVRAVTRAAGYTARIPEPFPPLVNVVNRGPLTRREYYNVLAELLDGPPPEFEQDRAASGVSQTGRVRGTNKRVISRYQDTVGADFQFDDIPVGIRHAAENSAGIRF